MNVTMMNGVLLGIGRIACVFLFSLICMACASIPRDLKDQVFASFDTETTGVNHHKDKVVEIGVVLFRDREVLARKQWLIDPGVSIPPYIVKIHGITDDMVRGKPSFAKVWPEFKACIGDATLLAHNARFDLRFLTAELDRAGIEPPANRTIDTLTLARRWYPLFRKHDLRTVIHAAHVKTTKSFHRALADSEYVRLFFLKGLAGMEPDANMKTLSELAGGYLYFGGQAPPQMPRSEASMKSQNSSAGP